jgi:hypothetical protein
MSDRLSDSLVAPKEDLGEAGAPGNEIEITPEMIEAGVSILLAADYRFESHWDVVKDILHAARKSRSVAP